jgi:GNAT superfamily N-acetyltransferase
MREAELLRWCSEPELELNEQRVRSALARGDLCLGAFHGERLVGYQWIGLGSTPHVAGLWVQVKPDDCYIYKKFVRPAYRGQRIAGQLNVHANQIAARHGRTRIIHLIDLANLPSWQVAKRIGSSTVGYAGYIAWFTVPIPFHSPGATNHGFRFYDPRIRPKLPTPRTA